MNDLPTSTVSQIGKWLDEWVNNGKIPGAVKAIAHVVGATGDAGAAWIKIIGAKGDQIRRGIEDETDARAVIKKALVEKAIGQLDSEPEIVERAMDSWAQKLVGSQVNRESVAAIAIENLRADMPNENVEAPSEDWLNLFGSYAEQASSDELRHLWGRVLAGEIRAAGSFSRRTLHAVSMLDKNTALEFEYLIRYAISNDYILRLEKFTSGKYLNYVNNLEAAGLVHAALGLSVKEAMKAKTYSILFLWNHGIVYSSDVDADITLGIISLTSVASELAKILSPSSDAEIVAEYLKFMDESLPPECSLKYGDIGVVANQVSSVKIYERAPQN
jgi:hypothetical protein